MNDSPESLLGQDNISSSSGGIGGTSHSNTNIGALQGRSIVDTYNAWGRMNE
jgi:hypothetical protein